VKDDDSFEVYEQEGIKAKLGEGLDEKGKLSKKPISRTIEVLKLFRDIIQLQPIKSVLPIATSAVREASNREEFLNEVYQETGFRFKVLSEREEALYSYVGAIKSLQLPNALFFDLGGGSLEIVHAEKFRIKKVISLPLGALRLTQQFDGRNSTFTEKNYKNMRRHIWNLLPRKKEFVFAQNTVLIGVGGALRALARYDQKVTKYPFDKIHNYKMNFMSVSTICKRLSDMKSDEIGKISVIGSSRAETIVAGSCVINTLMEKLGFRNLRVSNHGLREGALSIFLENQKTYHSNNITSEQIRQTVISTTDRSVNKNTEGFLKGLVSSKLIGEHEHVILSYALKLMSEKSSYDNPQSWFYAIADEDMSISHSDQLILGLSLVHTRHEKTADWLFSRYKSILTPQDKAAVRKISSLVNLLKFLEKTKAKIEIKKFEHDKVDLNIMLVKALPKTLLQNILRKFESAFDVYVTCSIRSEMGGTQNSILEL
jgi:exopolyphosphatase/guanosine-5'-triphosphate,3'-diphosphate pyrophosphatase